MMTLHGTKVIQSVVLILEGDNPAEVKEQVSRAQLVRRDHLYSQTLIEVLSIEINL